MSPAFIIHSSTTRDRESLVKELKSKTSATIVEATMLPDPRKGLTISHIQVAKLARALHPTSHYLVFEDDCELSEDWQRCLEGMEIADVVYLGYNGFNPYITYGTHALLLSPKARDAIIADAEELGENCVPRHAFDHILSTLAKEKGFVVCKPPRDDKERWAWQRKGLRSTITGQVR